MQWNGKIFLANAFADFDKMQIQNVEAIFQASIASVSQGITNISQDQYNQIRIKTSVSKINLLFVCLFTIGVINKSFFFINSSYKLFIPQKIEIYYTRINIFNLLENIYDKFFKFKIPHVVIWIVPVYFLDN